MAILKITIEQFIQQAGKYPVLDVRSPGEYSHAHFPGAHNLPLFSDEERKVVGTIYKKEGKPQAIKAGLAYFGPKMVAMVEAAERIAKESPIAASPPRSVIVHCWRGGMRSAGISWLLDLYGFEVYTLAGGYKAFRRWCGQQFAKPYPFSVLGGYTGSGKTGILRELKALGKSVLDLESLASHKGSAFGHLGEPPQPTQEMFENRLALALADLAHSTTHEADSTTDARLMDQADPIWLEDESQRIGSVNIPTDLFRHIQTRPVYFLDIPFEKRLDHIVRGYGHFEKSKLAEAITRLQKRLGGQKTRTALDYLEEGNLPGCFSILLEYYDKYYLKGLSQKQSFPAQESNHGTQAPSSQSQAHSTPQVQKIPCTCTDAATNTAILLRQ